MDLVDFVLKDVIMADMAIKQFTGIGSRESPSGILALMTRIAEHLCSRGYILRSGGADGADEAFQNGCDNVNGSKEIYIPWRGFNNSASQLYTISEDAFLLASTIHPAWDKLSQGAKKLHARNVYQVLGPNLSDPVDLLICWTKNGKDIGGTRTAIVLARQYNIRIINLAIEDFDFLQFN